MSSKKEVPPDQDNREAIVSELSRNLLVEAAAGTGKTTSMIDRMVALLRSGSCPSISTMAAVTFTRKAAAELRGKFRVRLERAATEAEGEEKERLESSLSAIDQCYIGTIHSFCSRLLRERPVEAGVDLAFTELENDDDRQLRKDAWAEHISRLRSSDPEGLLERLDSLGVDVRDLADYFINKFTDYPDVEEWPINETEELPDLSETVREIEAYARDMSAMAPELPQDSESDNLIPKYKKIPRVVSHYTAPDEPRQCAEILTMFNKKGNATQKVWKKTGRFTADDARNEQKRWADFQAEFVNPALRSFQESRYPVILKILQGAQGVYDRLRLQGGGLNYQDLLMKAASMLRDKPHIREYFKERYTHLLVDEFQDTDPIQAEVMMLLCATDPGETDWRECRPRPGALFVVGDPKQSIYRFRRADIVTYNEVKEIIQKEDKDSVGMVVSLSANFRTHGNIIDWVNRVFGPEEEGAPNKKKSSKRGMSRFPSVECEESPAYVPLQTGRIEGTEGEISGIYQLTIPEECSREELILEYEPDRIARTILQAVRDKTRVPRSRKELEDGCSPHAAYGDFMIVTPKRKHLSAFARKLQEYGIPHQVTGGAAMNEVSELKLFHKLLSAVVRPDDPVALVAALRSEVFGISDSSLYEFKQEGGRFNYRSPVPEGLCTPVYQSLDDAFSRLRRYSAWLSLLPPVSAFEKIVADLGLMVPAASRAGGDVQAGSMAKAIELLRRFQNRTWSPSQLVEYLAELVAQAEKYDGISVRSAEDDVVRVMNLHKVKGLEAPVVFLAAPFGNTRHPPPLHVDRGGGRIRGYLHLYKLNHHGQKGETIAQPSGWDELEEREAAFQEAELLRLLYVAATRAGSALVITQREKKNHFNRWSFFEPHLSDTPELPDPGEVTPESRPEELLESSAVRQAYEDISLRLERAARPSCVSRAAKQLALSGRDDEDYPYIYELAEGSQEPLLSGEHGVEWGSAIHALLQVAMDVPDAELVSRAESILAEQDLSPALAETAAAVVSAVLSSELWQRAKKSRKHLTEVPFEARLEGDEGPPALARGVIDLAFQEDDGWVLVDYKTDAAENTQGLAKQYAPQLDLYARAWQESTSENVKEADIYFVRTGKVYRVI